MSSIFRRRSCSTGHRLATAQEAHQALTCGTASHKSGLPQQPPFLPDLPHLGESYEPVRPATKQLKQIIDDNYYAAAFESAITTVSRQQVPELDRIHTLAQFYYYVDQLVTWIPGIRLWDWDGEVLHERTDYVRLTQFYYYFNQPELEALQSPIAPLQGAKLSPISRWLRDFAVEWGAFLDTPESSKYLASYQYAPEYAWQDYEKKPQDYRTFNEWFARCFKNIAVQRPVAQPDNDRVIAFPAESTFVGQWAVSTEAGAPLPSRPSIVVKHIEWSIAELLQDSEHSKAFEGGIFCHSFLNVFDYHRQHAPVSGTILEAKFIPGQVYLEVELEHLNKEEREESNSDLANAIIPRRHLDASDPTGYQFVQCRGLLILDSPIGKVAILPMGMAQVSSVVFVTPEAEGQQPIVLTPEEKQGCCSYEEQVSLLNEKIASTLVGKRLTKGEMFSYFQFGGSDIVMVFERKANVDITAQMNVHYPIRSQLAVSNIDKLRCSCKEK